MAPTEEILAPAKINLFLEVHPRPPGARLHPVETVVEKVTLYDRLSIRTTPGRIEVVTTPCDISMEENLVYRAAVMLRDTYGIRAGASIKLHKEIPVGAGLGGGSSDAAAALKALNRLWKIGATPGELAALALGIGSDVPAFILPGRCLVGGFGEKVSPLCDAGSFSYYIVRTGIPVSTADAYRRLDGTAYRPLPAGGIIRALETGGPAETGAALFNRFEATAVGVSAGLRRWREMLGKCRGWPLLAGSGGCFFVLRDGAPGDLSAVPRMRRKHFIAVSTCDG